MSNTTLGQIAWEAYGRSEKDQGLMRPAKEYRWKDLDGVTQSLWNAAAQAVASAVRAETAEVVQAAEAFVDEEKTDTFDALVAAIAALRARRGTP